MDKPWKEAVRRALDASGQAYFAVLIDPKLGRATTLATLSPEHLVSVLRDIANEVERGELPINSGRGPRTGVS